MKKILFLLLVATVFSLSSCGWTKEKLGLSRKGPDATTVKTNQPLILPPEYSVRPQKSEDASKDYWKETSDDE